MRTPVFTGLDALDELTGGLKPGELVIVGGRPAMGKTSFAINLLGRAGIGNGVCCFLLELEGTEKQITHQLYAYHTRYYHALNSKRKRSEMEDFYKEYIENGPVWIDDTPIPDLDMLAEKWRMLKEKHELRFIVIDYIFLMLTCGQETFSLQAAMKYTMTWLKRMAKELSIPIIILSQISRAAAYRQDKHPIMSDLNDTIAESADQVIFLYRDDYYNRDAEQYNIAEFILAKHPEGKAGTAKAVFRYTPQGFLIFDNYIPPEIHEPSGENGKRIVVGRTRHGAEISICKHCEAYGVPHFNFVYGEGRDEALYFDKPMLLDSVNNLDLTTRMDLQAFLTPESWKSLIETWNENNDQQLSPDTHIPYYINLLQYQDTAIVTTREEREHLGATLYVGVKDQDQRPHFHYERPDGSAVCVSLTASKYLPPVEKPLSEQELERLVICLETPDNYGITLYRRLLEMWSCQGNAIADENQSMPDYRELGKQEL